MSGGTELLPERHRSRKLDLNDEFSICPYCGKYLLFPLATIEHILPYAILTWTSEEDERIRKELNIELNKDYNVILTCSDCNKMKGMYIPTLEEIKGNKRIGYNRIVRLTDVYNRFEKQIQSARENVESFLSSPTKYCYSCNGKLVPKNAVIRKLHKDKPRDDSNKVLLCTQCNRRAMRWGNTLMY